MTAQSRNWRGHSGRVVESKNGFEIVQCSRCGFKHLVPIPSEEELKKIYEKEYYSSEKPLYIERNLEDQEWWKTVYDGRLDLFESLLASDRRRILDVGCGPGFFLYHVMQRGWKGLGIEPSKQASTFAQSLGVEVKNGFLNDQPTGELGTFDVVYMNEVLEHVSDPIGLLTTAVGLLNPGGLLCVIVPNDYNPIQQALQDVCDFPSWWVAPPHHINYFDVSSIKALLERAGTEIVHSEATFPIDLFLMMGDNYVGNDEMGRECHSRRKNLEINLARAGLAGLKRALYCSFAETGLGREIQVVGQKC
jgi:SAM-dependent methyltransferase